MKKLKNMSISSRLILTTSSVIVVILIAILIVIGLRVNNFAENSADLTARETAYNNSNKYKVFIEEALNEARALRDVFESAVNDRGINLSRDNANSILKSFIEKNKQFLGVYVCFEPNAFDGSDGMYVNKQGHDKTGRFIPYWTRGENGKGFLEPLVDYTKTGDGDYYQIPMNRKRESVIDPYLYKVQGKDVLLTSLVVPIKDRAGNFIGISGIDIRIDEIAKKTASSKVLYDGEVDIFSQGGVVVASKNLKFLGKNIKEISTNEDFNKEILNGKGEFSLKIKSEETSEILAIVGIPVEIGQTGQFWKIVVKIPEEKMFAESKDLIMLISLIGIIAIILIVFMMRFIARNISNPIIDMVLKAEMISNGDFTVDIEADSENEIGKLYSSLKSLTEKLREVLREITDSANHLAVSSQEMSSTTVSFSDNAQSQAASAEEVTATIEEISAGIENIARSTTHQTGGIQTLLNGMNELSELIGNMGVRIKETVNLSDTISSSASAGEKSLGDMHDRMGKIMDSSQKVTDIVRIINDIFDQINLLSLNAAIEAARAGEAGKGFAVVADEISKLADETSTSIKDIEMLISQNNSEINQGMNGVIETIDVFSRIIEDINSINDKMKEISVFMEKQVETGEMVNREAAEAKARSEEIQTATEEQKTATSEIAKSITTINEITQANASGTEEIAGNSEEIAGIAEKLKERIQYFRI